MDTMSVDAIIQHTMTYVIYMATLQSGLLMEMMDIQTGPTTTKYKKANNVMINISEIKQQPQRQDSFEEQLRDLVAVANRLGMYDAADYIHVLDITTKKIEKKKRHANL